MEKLRYWGGIIFGVTLAIVGVWTMILYGITSVLYYAIVAYVLLSITASLIWWCGLPKAVFCFISINIGWEYLCASFSNFLELDFDNGGFFELGGIIINFAIISLCILCISAGFFLSVILSCFTFPIYLIKSINDLD